MNLDVRTLALVLALGHVVQVVALALQLAVGNRVRGLGWWLAWSSSVAVGGGFILLRQVPALEVAATALQNVMILAGVSFLYVGLMRFHGRRERTRMLLGIGSSFLFGHLYFALVHDDMEVRSMLFAVAIGAIGLLTASDLFKARAVSPAASAGFLTLLLTFHGLFFLWRGGSIALGAPVPGLFDPSPFNAATFLEAIVVGNLLTMGLIILVNQRLHREVVEARDHFERLFETSPDAVIITRMADGVCCQVNQGLERLSGYDRSELLGRSTVDAGIYADPVERQRIVDELMLRGSVTGIEVGFVRRDGSHFTGSMSARLIDLQGVPHVISVTRDVSERKRAEEELARQGAEIRELNAGLERRVAERTAELERTNRELEGFVHSIAHDLRAPLRAIDGFSGVLEEEHSAALPGEGRRYLDRVRRGARAMDRLITDLLEYARTGTVELTRGRVDMAALARRVFDEIATAEERASVEFSVGDLPPTEGDPRLLRAVFRHLLDNAIKYTAAQPRRQIEVTAGREAETVAYRVSDNGVGFDPIHSGKLFGVFQRLHVTGEFDGTGIGLAIVKRIVERHGGQVRAEGAVNQGAAVTFSLPERGPDHE